MSDTIERPAEAVDMPWLDASSASALSASLGMPVAKATLNKMRTIGGGPPFRRFGRKVLYGRVPFQEWLISRLGPEQRSTSDREAA